MKSVTSYFDNEINNNVLQANNYYAEDIQLIKDSLNTQRLHRETYDWILGNTHLSNLGLAETPIYSALIKNEFSLYSCLKLTTEGLYGSARMLLRSVYESLMIAKYASLSQSESFIQKWKEGETIYFTNAVLKRITKPEFNELNNIWTLLCELSHATVYAQQISIEYKDIEDQLGANFGIIMILQNCNYHLQNRHFVTSSMQHYTKRYRSEWDNGKSKNDAKVANNNISSIMTKRAKLAVKEYCSKWELKNSNR